MVVWLVVRLLFAKREEEKTNEKFFHSSHTHTQIKKNIEYVDEIQSQGKTKKKISIED